MVRLTVCHALSSTASECIGRLLHCRAHAGRKRLPFPCPGAKSQVMIDRLRTAVERIATVQIDLDLCSVDKYNGALRWETAHLQAVGREGMTMCGSWREWRGAEFERTRLAWQQVQPPAAAPTSALRTLQHPMHTAGKTKRRAVQIRKQVTSMPAAPRHAPLTFLLASLCSAATHMPLSLSLSRMPRISCAYGPQSTFSCDTAGHCWPVDSRGSASA